MSIEIEDAGDVRSKLDELGCNSPTGLCLLPTNLFSASSIADLRQYSESATVKTLFRSVALECEDVLDRSRRPPYIQNNYSDWVGPALLVSSALWSQNPLAVSVALSVIGNYLTDFFRGVPQPRVRLDFVVERTKTRTCKKLSYEGDIGGLAALEHVIREISND